MEAAVDPAIWGVVLFLVLIAGVFLLLALLAYPAILLGLFAYAYILRGGQEPAWYLNLTVITLLLTCASVILYRLWGRRLRFRPCVYDSLVLLLVLLLLAGSLGTNEGLTKAARFAGLVALPYFLARVILVSPRQLRIFAYTVMYGAVVVAGLLVINKLSPWLLPFFLTINLDTTRIQFIETNQVALGTFFAVGAVLAFVLLGRGRRRLFLVPVLVLLVYVTFWTGTRSPILAMSIVGTLYIASVFVRSPSRGTAVLLGVTLGVVWLLSSGVYEALPNWDRFESALTGREYDLSIQSRQGLWDQAVATFLANPLTGGGTASLSSYPHNIYLELAAENGIVGAGLMVVVTLLAIRRVWFYVFRAGMLSQEQRTLFELAILPFVALLVIKQFSFDLTMHKDLFIWIAAIANLRLLLSSAGNLRQAAPSVTNPIGRDGTSESRPIRPVHQDMRL